MAVMLFHRQEGTGGGGTLSDAQTVEHNVLGPGVIGHILRHRTWNTSTYAATDKWFGYDQVGSVLHETNSAGNLSTRHYQDAWGNVQQSYTTGLWNSGATGWHHNTKEADADAGLVYMFERQYASSTGVFQSGSPYDPMIESRYSFAFGNPVNIIDPDGRLGGPLGGFVGGILGAGAGAIGGAVWGAIKCKGLPPAQYHWCMCSNIMGGLGAGAMGGALFGSGAFLGGLTTGTGLLNLFIIRPGVTGAAGFIAGLACGPPPPPPAPPAPPPPPPPPGKCPKEGADPEPNPNIV